MQKTTIKMQHAKKHRQKATTYHISTPQCSAKGLNWKKISLLNERYIELNIWSWQTLFGRNSLIFGKRPLQADFS